MTSWHQPSDSSFLLAMLKDGKRHSTNQIIQASLAERGVGLTVHSRAADLRSNGHNVICEAGPRRNGRTTYFYRLATLPKPSLSNSFGVNDPQYAREVGREGFGSTADTGAAFPPLSPEVAPAQLALELPHRWEPAA